MGGNTPYAEEVLASRRRLARAGSIEELLREVGHYVERLPAFERASLPQGYCPVRVVTQDDLVHWTKRLHGAPGVAASHAVRDFFIDAHSRAQRLRPRAA